LWHVTNRWQAVMRTALEPHGLTHVQYVLLASLVWLHHDDPANRITQANLAEFAATDVMMTSQVVRALEQKDLLERLPHPHDGRARLLRPTPAGTRVARAATADVEDADDSFFSRLHDAAAFAGELGRLRTPPPVG
jgi:DNA-binding MarR family transcriptional regulator